MITPRRTETDALVELLDKQTDDGHPFWETPEELAKALLKQAFTAIQGRSLVFVNWRVAGGAIQVGPFATQADALRWHAGVGGEGTVHTLTGPGVLVDPRGASSACAACGHAKGLHDHPKAYGRCMADHKHIDGPGCACGTFTKEEAA
jgi:hypothetical protein